MRTLLVLTVMLSSSLAAAQTEDDGAETSRHGAPARAFEITTGMAYGRGFGHVDGGEPSLRDGARGGPSLQLGLGYRINPRFMVGAYFEGSSYFRGSSVEDETRLYATAMGLQGTYFVAPFKTLNPWVSLGTGVRAYFVDRPTADASAAYGWDIGRLSLGLDYRLSPTVSIGPMLGATITTFGAQGELDDPQKIHDREPSMFAFAGFQGRFDVAGARVSSSRSDVASR